MMDIRNISIMMRKWYLEVGYYIHECPPEAKVITGRQVDDGMYHQFEKDSGVLLTLSENQVLIEKYEIVDEQQFTAFVLRWA